MIFQGQARLRLPFRAPVMPDDLARSRLRTSRRGEVQWYLADLEAPPALRDHEAAANAKM